MNKKKNIPERKGILTIRRKDNNNDSIIKADRGKPAKIYLEVENAHPEHDTYTWSIPYIDINGESQVYVKIMNSKNILLVLPNSLLTRSLVVYLKTSKRKEFYSLPSLNQIQIYPFAIKEKEKEKEEPIEIPDEETSRKFSAVTNMEVGDVKFLTPNGTERVPDSEGFYKIAGEYVYLKFEVEARGVNQETIYLNASSKGCDIVRRKAIVNANRAIFDYIPTKYIGKDIKEDTLTIDIYGENNIQPKQFEFKLKLNIRKGWTDDEIMPFKEVAVVGYGTKVVENNYHPCKFTDIEFKEVVEDKSAIVKLQESKSDFFENSFDTSWRKFDDQESENILVIKEEDTRQFPVYEVVAGQKNKEIKLSIKDFKTDPKDCKNNPQHTKSFLLAINGSIPQRIEVEKDETTIEVSYPYITETITNALNHIALPIPIAPKFLPIDCLFPTWRPKMGVIKIESCRRNVEIPIRVYPDIQWYVTAYIKLTNGINLKKSPNPRLKEDSESKKDWRDIFDFKNGEVKDTMKSSFKLGLLTCWNNSNSDESMANLSEGDVDSSGTQNYSALYFKPLEQPLPKLEGSAGYLDALKEFTENKFYSVLFETVRTLQDVISIVELMKLAVELANSVEYKFDLDVARKDLFTFEITPPDLNLAIGWRAGANNGKVGLVMEGRGNGTIVGIKGCLDLYCLASKIPATKTAILALELIQWASGIEFVFNLEFGGELGWEGELGFHEARNAWQNRFAITGKIPVTLNLKMTVKPGENYTAVTEDENEYGITGTAGITGLFEFTYLPEQHEKASEGAGIYNKNKAVFDPIKVIFYKKSSSMNKGSMQGLNSTDGKGEEIVLWDGVPFWETETTKIV